MAACRLLISLTLLALNCVPALAADTSAPAVKTGTLESAALVETSGMAASRINANVLWAHNDSGDSARMFAFAPTGKHLGVFDLQGVVAVDWEDIAVGPGSGGSGSWIYAGDIGDNFAVRSSVVVYRFAEPKLDAGDAAVTGKVNDVQALRLQYEDGARDAETLMIDSLTGDLYIISKREARSRIYRAAANDLRPGRIIRLKMVGELAWAQATGGDISPDGSKIIIRGYKNCTMWHRAKGQSVADALAGEGVESPLMSEPQGEAVCFAADGSGYYTVSEGRDSPIYFFPIETGRGEAPGPKCD